TPAFGPGRGVAATREAPGGSPNDVAALAHGTTVATNALLQGPISGLGLIVTAGFHHLLEIARQSVPAGYGNSYFWVKPERIVPLHFVREVGGRLNFRGEEIPPLAEARAGIVRHARYVRGDLRGRRAGLRPQSHVSAGRAPVRSLVGEVTDRWPIRV